MKTKKEIKVEKTMVSELREIRDKLNLEMEDMSIEKLKEFLKQKKTLHPSWYL